MCFIFLSKIVIVKSQKQKLYTMGRSKKRLKMLHERRAKKEQRRRELFQRGVKLDAKTEDEVEVTKMKCKKFDLRGFYNVEIVAFMIILVIVILLVCLVEFFTFVLNSLNSFIARWNSSGFFSFKKD